MPTDKQLQDLSINQEIEYLENFNSHDEAVRRAEIKGKKGNRIEGRNFHFIVWEESAPPDWLGRLEDLMLPFAVSPRHDSDIATVDDVRLHDEKSVREGQLIKPHFHVMLQYANTTTLSNVKSIVFETLNTEKKCVNTVFKTKAPSGMYQYLTHANRPKKHQYQEEDIKLLNNFSVTKVMEELDTAELMSNIDDYIEVMQWKYYFQMMDYFRHNGMMNEYSIVTKHTSHYREIFSSKRLHKTDLDKEALNALSLQNQSPNNKNNDC